MPPASDDLVWGRYVGIPHQHLVDGEITDFDVGEWRPRAGARPRDDRTRRVVRAIALGPCSGSMCSWYESERHRVAVGLGTDEVVLGHDVRLPRFQAES